MEHRNQLAENVWHYQSERWRTNALLAVEAEHALVVDPCWEASEIARIHADADADSRTVHLLLTHADADHTCGIGFFPDAVVVGEAETAKRIRDGSAAAQLAAVAAEWGTPLPTDLRVDRVIEVDADVECGPFKMATFKARGHTSDGLAVLLRDSGVLIAGDYLSATSNPWVWTSVSDACRATETILDALDRNAVRWVMPGHGPVLAPRDAAIVGQEDLLYLERLLAEAAAARKEGLSWGEAMLSLMAVPPPRASPPDFELYNPKFITAEAALAEAGLRRPQ